jgi:hypothetical protein
MVDVSDEFCSVPSTPFWPSISACAGMSMGTKDFTDLTQYEPCISKPGELI